MSEAGANPYTPPSAALGSGGGPPAGSRWPWKLYLALFRYAWRSPELWRSP